MSRNLVRALIWVAAPAVLGLAPVLAQAAGIGFRNNLKTPVIVQGASVVNGMLRRGQPLLIAPAKIGWDNNLPPGVRFITIYDANQPSNILFRGPVPVQSQDLFFGIRTAAGSPDRVILMPEPVP